ncbi:hypothetical protein CC1G_01804 [Coprinopsis cinerea okayama7|uniref:RRM domain-containing protein n=1 Tax=Coprinopsis cinerea (strain Okayama-7 / 130 / ATCC MYA-4618 / FGSC 9003) TaxID=240176 RepID=A8N2F1_COPC7|nr:hypothetical protein CC1G_01804 [Coprinopsis cinerea okayama7\|eukprot:XP_001829124.1 hypothetical protein CC1G_01804 [Coprinopsis cinerea okayama7\
MDDHPYTTPDEDPFHVQPPARLVFHKRSSLIDKWIHDQQQELETDTSELMLPPPKIHDEEEPRCGTPTHPFLAYPDIGRLSLDQLGKRQDDASTLYSYDLVDDDDIPEVPATPINKSPKTLLTSSTFRNLNLSFRATANANSTGTTSTTDDHSSPSPRSQARMSIFSRSSRHTSATAHTRSASLSTVNTTMLNNSPTVKGQSASTSKWRPSVLGYFPQSPSTPTIPFDPTYTPPRPSLSSGDTYTSSNSASQTATTLESDLPTTPSRPSFFESIRSKNRSSLSIFRAQSGHASSSSIWSQPYRAPFDDQEAPLEIPPIGSGADSCRVSTSEDANSTLPRRVPFAMKSVNQYDNLLDDEDDLAHYVPPPSKRESTSTRSSISFTAPNNTFSRVGFGSLNTRGNQKKKKKLVISGVGVHETRKFEGVRRWCESFGEIRQVTRAPNGDLHIEFRKADVADTVCRVRAKVFIAGVGSVYLSWITGDKR